MGYWIKWVLAAIAAAAISAIVQPPIARFLAGFDIYTAPVQIMNWLEQIVGQVAFPWIAAGSIGLAAGVWLDPLLRRLDGRHPIGKVARARALSWKVTNMGHRLRSHLNSIFTDRGDAPTIWIESILTLEKMEKLGIVAPADVVGPYSRERAERLCAYFQVTGPLLREGAVDAAAAIGWDDPTT
jgi:hypothetical protein